MPGSVSNSFTDALLRLMRRSVGLIDEAEAWFDSFCFVDGGGSRFKHPAAKSMTASKDSCRQVTEAVLRATLCFTNASY